MNNRQLVECQQALELARVGVTAAIDVEGRLKPVGRLWPKLLAAVQEAATLGLLRAVVRQQEREACANLDVLGRPVLINTLYQVLPLLREVKRERLPSQPGMVDRDEETGPSLYFAEIQWREEELRAEQVTDERVTLERVFTNFRVVARGAKSDVPQLVVLGPSDTCVRKLGDAHNQCEMSQVICWFNPGGLVPHQQVLASMCRFAHRGHACGARTVKE